MGTRHYDVIGQRHTLKERCAQSYADNVDGGRGQLLEKKSVTPESWPNLREPANSGLKDPFSEIRRRRFFVTLFFGGEVVLPGPEHEGRVHVDGRHATHVANLFGNHPQLLKVHQAVHFGVVAWEIREGGGGGGGGGGEKTQNITQLREKQQQPQE